MPSGQSHKLSLLEAIANNILGYLLSLGLQMIVFPLYGLKVSFSDNVQLGLIFAVFSIARSYGLRRFFNYIHVRKTRC